MPEVLLLSESELKQVVPLDLDSVQCMEDCFHTQSTDGVIMPPIMQLDLDDMNGGVCIKTAYLPGVDSFAVKISPGFYDNPKIGLPTTNGLMNLFNSRTGILEAVLMDNGYLTEVRTAAAGALSAKWLGTSHSESITIIGAGAQARFQLQAISLVRDIKEITIWARDSKKSNIFAKEILDQYEISAQIAHSPGEACEHADIIVTTTPSTSPLIRFQDLSAGQLVIAMGSDYKQKTELAVDVLTDCDRYVCDRLSQVQTLGELHHGIEAGAFSVSDHFDELGDVIAGTAPGRKNDTEIIVCDLTGTGAQDTAIATMARQRAEDSAMGRKITA